MKWQLILLMLFLAISQTHCTQKGVSNQAVSSRSSTNSLNVKPSPIRPRVRWVKIRTKFFVRRGGGADISPKEGIYSDGDNDGDEIPAISMSNNSVFVAGELKVQGEGIKLIKIVCDFENPLQQIESFKIGDVALIIGQYRSNNFLAVGYDSKLCEISHEYRDSVKKIVVEVPAKGTKTLSFVFAFALNNFKQGSIVIGGSTPVPFQVNSRAYK